MTDVTDGAIVSADSDVDDLLRVALEQAREAKRAGDHPYGSLVVAAA